MRFMLIVKASESEAGILPDEEALAEMAKFNEQMVKAGVMLAGDGLQASSKGARVEADGAKRTVVDGPFEDPNSRCRLLDGPGQVEASHRVGQARAVRRRRGRDSAGVRA